MVGVRRVAQEVLRAAKRAEATDAAVDLEESTTYMVRFSNNEITVSKVFHEYDVSVYLAIGERRGVATTSVLSLSELKKLVAGLAATTRMAGPSDIYAPLPRGPFKYEPGLLSRGRRAPPPEELVEWVEAAVSGARNSGAARVAGSLIVGEVRRTLYTSGGVRAESRAERIELSVRAFLDGASSGQFSTATGSREEFNPYRTGEVAGEIARMARNPVSGEPGVYDAILGPMTFANILEEVGRASSAYSVLTGFSFLEGRLGESVASKILTLIDDPTLLTAYGSEAFDDEGLPTRSKVIIDSGELKTYLHNSATAKKFGVESTANAGWISPEPFNLVVEGGGATLNQLLSRVDRGIFVTNDWYLRYRNFRTGEFSTIPRDGLFIVRNGSIEGALRDLRLSDSIPRMLSNLEEMTADKYWIKWWEVDVPVKAPYALIRGVNFTKSTI
ncbi:MAG: TldD/PmbA family protein [Nitrososphaerota archaeon]|nr:TldD/PmbA family protein [Candidatus Calditenuaceae archaeon]MDW8073766.1 TldD/PmbA family protein [Nitrososphaerota archaeon]